MVFLVPKPFKPTRAVAMGETSSAFPALASRYHEDSSSESRCFSVNLPIPMDSPPTKAKPRALAPSMVWFLR